jgi:hypothetical protein
MTAISNEYMQEMMTKSRNYNLVILMKGLNYEQPDARSVIWEHARRNFQLRADGKLSIVCPVADSSDVRGIGIFNADENELKEIMDEDPGVKSGIFIYQIYPVRSFPGDQLP